jgi:conserved oligomeric Golgi complex subunit 6
MGKGTIEFFREQALRAAQGKGNLNTCNFLLFRSFGGSQIRIQVRVLQTVRAQESSITSYKIANLLQYYMLTMQRTIGDQSLLSQALQE